MYCLSQILLFRYIITLGHTGCLVCTKQHRSASTAQRCEDLKRSLETDDVIAMFQNPTTGFVPKGFTFTRWIDMERISKLESEKLQFKQERLQIMKDFKAVKSKLRKLLDANDVATDEQRLPVQAFNLNESTTEELKERVMINLNRTTHDYFNLIQFKSRQNSNEKRNTTNC